MKLITSLSLALPLLAGLSSTAYANQHWPDLPEGVKSGVSAQVGNKLYVGLGSMEQRFYMLDLDQMDKGWQQQADFSGPARSGATAAVLGDSIYIFGGSGKANASDKSPILFDTVYRFDAKTNQWEQVKTKTPVACWAPLHSLQTISKSSSSAATTKPTLTSTSLISTPQTEKPTQQAGRKSSTTTWA